MDIIDTRPESPNEAETPESRPASGTDVPPPADVVDDAAGDAPTADPAAGLSDPSGAAGDDVSPAADAVAEGEDSEAAAGLSGEADAAPESVSVPAEESLAGNEPQDGDESDTVLRSMLEAVVYVTEEPLSAEQIAVALEKPITKVRALLAEVQAEYDLPHHGLTIREVAGGYKMGTKPEHHETIRAFVKKLTPPLKLSLAALETLAVIAYKQPITAPEIMEIRGVQGAGVLKTLLDRKLITTSGRKQVIGKPILYRTTKDFLVQFGLKDTSELPSLKEFEELKRLSLGDDLVGEAEPQAAQPAAAAPETAGQTPEPAESAPEAAPAAPEPSEQLPEPAEPAPVAAPATPEPSEQLPEPAEPASEAATAAPEPAEQTPEPAEPSAQAEPGSAEVASEDETGGSVPPSE